MTLEEAYKKLDLTKESPIRVVSVAQLHEWEKKIDAVLTKAPELEDLSHEIMSVAL